MDQKTAQVIEWRLDDASMHIKQAIEILQPLAEDYSDFPHLSDMLFELHGTIGRAKAAVYLLKQTAPPASDSE
jgi:hypothetical protein